jgi:hypothetical protein
MAQEKNRWVFTVNLTILFEEKLKITQQKKNVINRLVLNNVGEQYANKVKELDNEK